jgi:hypothetical protein
MTDEPSIQFQITVRTALAAALDKANWWAVPACHSVSARLDAAGPERIGPGEFGLRRSDWFPQVSPATKRAVPMTGESR